MEGEERVPILRAGFFEFLVGCFEFLMGFKRGGRFFWSLLLTTNGGVCCGGAGWWRGICAVIRINRGEGLVGCFCPTVFALSEGGGRFHTIFPSLAKYTIGTRSVTRTTQGTQRTLNVTLVRLRRGKVRFPTTSSRYTLRHTCPCYRINIILLSVSICHTCHRCQVRRTRLSSTR